MSDKPKLILIGYWCGGYPPQGNSSYPDPGSMVDLNWNVTERDLVLKHLQGGSLYGAYKGWSTCRCCGELNGTSELTDGVYVWPNGLTHYVGAHGVRLPEKFVEHVRNFSGQTWEPGYIDARVDHDWWKALVGSALHGPFPSDEDIERAVMFDTARKIQEEMDAEILKDIKAEVAARTSSKFLDTSTVFAPHIPANLQEKS